MRESSIKGFELYCNFVMLKFNNNYLQVQDFLISCALLEVLL